MAGFGMLTKRALLKGATAAALSSSGSVFAKADDQVLLSLEFRTYGANAPSYYGIDNGIYSKLGLNVVPEGSAGSGE